MSEKRAKVIVPVPKISRARPSRLNPKAAEAQAAHVKWADEHRVFASEEQRKLYAAMDIGDLAGRMCPDASLEVLRLVADWSAWLLLRDDRWDTTADLKEWERLAELDRAYLRLMRRPDEAPPEGTPACGDGLASALRDLCKRLRSEAKAGVPDPVDGGFISLMREFFTGSVRQAFYQRREEVPKLADYLKLRPVTGGLEILSRVLVATEGGPMPAGVLEEEPLKRLTRASHNICCWHNDLVSLNKELYAGEVNNLVLVLLNDPESDCRTLPEAVEIAVTKIHAELDLFYDLVDEIETSRSPHADFASWYAGMLAERVSGTIAWFERCARYREIAPASPLSKIRVVAS